MPRHLFPVIASAEGARRVIARSLEEATRQSIFLHHPPLPAWIASAAPRNDGRAMMRALALALLIATPAYAESPMKTGQEAAFSPRPAMVALAMEHLGKTGPQLGLPSRLWCADFINRLRREAGYTPVPSRRAVDQARGGRRIASPRPGALMITHRRGGAHVDLVLAVRPDGAVTTIGGNVSRVVSIRERAGSGRAIYIMPE